MSAAEAFPAAAGVADRNAGQTMSRDMGGPAPTPAFTPLNLSGPGKRKLPWAGESVMLQCAHVVANQAPPADLCISNNHYSLPAIARYLMMILSVDFTQRCGVVACHHACLPLPGHRAKYLRKSGEKQVDCMLAITPVSAFLNICVGSDLQQTSQ